MGIVDPWRVEASRTKDCTCAPALAGGFSTTDLPGKSPGVVFTLCLFPRFCKNPWRWSSPSRTGVFPFCSSLSLLGFSFRFLHQAFISMNSLCIWFFFGVIAVAVACSLVDLGLFLFVFWPRCSACRILVPRPGSNSYHLRWNHKVLTSGPARKSLPLLFNCLLILAGSSSLLTFNSTDLIDVGELLSNRDPPLQASILKRLFTEMKGGMETNERSWEADQKTFSLPEGWGWGVALEALRMQGPS